jgi:hypothetical protein
VAGSAIEVEFTSLLAGDELRVVDETGTCQVIAADGARLVWSGRLDGRFKRFEVWHGAEPRLFTNPFYAD